MTDIQRTYIDPTGESLLFYILNPLDGGWYPDDTVTDDIWIFRPIDRPDIFITLPDRRIWPLMTVAEADAIRSFPEKPWFHGGSVIDYYPLMTILGGQTHYPGDQSFIENEGLMALALAMDLTISATPSVTTNSESSAPLPPLPPHIVATLLRCAEAEGVTCSITMEPVTVATGAVTACGHYFQKAAVERWLGEHGTCPECRQPTAI